MTHIRILLQAPGAELRVVLMQVPLHIVPEVSVVIISIYK